MYSSFSCLLTESTLPPPGRATPICLSLSVKPGLLVSMELAGTFRLGVRTGKFWTVNRNVFVKVCGVLALSL